MKNHFNQAIVFSFVILIIAGFSGSKFYKGEMLKRSGNNSVLSLSQEKKLESEPDINSVVNSSNQFAFDLYSNLKGIEGNIFFSPYSLSTAMAMTYEGARGQTAEEIRQVFHYPEDIEILRREYAETINQINKKDKKYELRTANALWAQKSYPFSPEYFKTVEKYYGGKVTNVDFARDTENSRLTINKWVEDQTNNRIRDLIPQGAINSLTRLVLTNAIYFKGFWQIPFEKRFTREDNFYLTPEQKVKVQMMPLWDVRLNYLEDKNFQMLELFYADGEISIILLLPRSDLSSVEDLLAANKIDELKTRMFRTKIDVYLPRFKFETKYLMGGEQGILGGMGMPTAFSERLANFSGMTSKPDFYNITQVVHQAFIEVNEQGTEAAAATGGGILGGVITVEGEPNPVFRADHPFIFFIQENRTGAILFLGRVMDPTR